VNQPEGSGVCQAGVPRRRLLAGLADGGTAASGEACWPRAPPAVPPGAAQGDAARDGADRLHPGGYIIPVFTGTLDAYNDQITGYAPSRLGQPLMNYRYMQFAFTR